MSPNSNTFIFNEKIDVQSLTDLYGDDFVYIEETFKTVLDEYDGIVQNIIAAYTSQQLQQLRSAVHKIKPVFGFVGLPGMQQQCQQFENACHNAASTDELKSMYSTLEENILHCKMLIKEETRRLENFNKQRA